MKKSDVLFTFLPLITAVTILLCFASPAISGEPLGDVYFYNVTPVGFSVVWQVDTPSTCTVVVYTDSAGTTPVSPAPQVYERTNGSPTAQDRGVMQVDVVGLLPETTYYVRTVSTGKATGPFTDTSTYYYPESGPLLSVKTVKEKQSPQTWNAKLALSVLHPDTGSALDNIVIIADVGAMYPVSYRSSTGKNGWPDNDTGLGNLILINFPLLIRNATGDYLDWTSTTITDKTMNIIILGGLVPGIGLGQRYISTIYPADLIEPSASSYPDGGCLLNLSVPNPPTSCAQGVINQYILYYNQPPQLVLPGEDTTDPLDSGIPAYYDEQLPLQICAYDPEGDPSTTFSLSGEPDWMYLQTSLTDANCIEIAGTPTMGGIYRNIKLRASDSDWATTSLTFTVIVTEGPPASQIEYPMVLPVGGWSMISLPVDPANPRADALFPDATAIFKHTTTGYELVGPDDDMVKGTGYWIFLPSTVSGNYSIMGYPIEEMTITNVPSGWSMIGGCTYSATAASEGGAIRGIFGFGNRYVHLKSSDPLPPGMGFWVNCSANATLNLDTIP
ncbi:MAG: hypothetical protein ACMUIS_10560 [bacterium]